MAGKSGKHRVNIHQSGKRTPIVLVNINHDNDIINGDVHMDKNICAVAASQPYGQSSLKSFGCFIIDILSFSLDIPLKIRIVSGFLHDLIRILSEYYQDGIRMESSLTRARVN